jgi:hypothetical protein
MKDHAKVAMYYPLDINPLTWLCRTISSSKVLCHNLFEYFK